jgi:hypothetical protein
LLFSAGLLIPGVCSGQDAIAALKSVCGMEAEEKLQSSETIPSDNDDGGSRVNLAPWFSLRLPMTRSFGVTATGDGGSSSASNNSASAAMNWTSAPYLDPFRTMVLARSSLLRL